MSSERASPASVARLSWVLFALAFATCVWLARSSMHRTPPPHGRAARSELTDAVPEGPALLVTLDATRLSESAVQRLVQAGGGRLLGLGELCGFEPLLLLRRAVFAMPPRDASASTDFALIADTALEPAAVLRCAEAVIRKRGGEPARSRLGAFESVRDRKKPLGEVAIRADGLLVLSGGEYFRRVIDAASGSRSADEAARLRGAIHAKLRGNLGPSQLVLSAVAGAPWSLPGVQALGLGLSIEEDARLRGLLYCAAPAACEEAQGVLRELLRELAKEPRLSAAGTLQVTTRGAELELSGRLPLEQLGPALAQLLAL